MAEQRLIEEHEISSLVLFHPFLAAQHQLRVLHLFGRDGEGCLAQLHSQSFANGLRIVVILNVSETFEHALNFIELDRWVGDGDLTDFPSLPFIEVIRKAAHQAKLRHKDSLRPFFFLGLSVAAGLEQGLFLGLYADVIGMSVILEHIDGSSFMGELI